jgi:tRNA-specific 2-thiouridylase
VIPAAGSELTIRIRYRSAAAPATVVAATESDFSVRFGSSVQGVATGQAAVLYDGDTVVGGGWIATVDGA